MSAPTATRWVYDFADGSRQMRDLLGGKGANIAEMTRVLGAELVPAGFTITTAACVAYMRDAENGPEGLDDAVDEALARLEEQAATGVAASPGAAKGEIVFTAPDAVAAAADGRAVILVRQFTEADDVAGFHAAKGILTAEGGKASHAALVARGMGRPAVTGAADLDIDLHAREVRVGDHVLHDGDLIAIDGSTADRPDHRRRRAARDARRGLALRARARLVRRAAHAGCARQRRLAGGRAPRERVRRRGHRTLPDRAHVHGRGSPAQDAAHGHGRGRGRPASALDELLPLQQADFEGLFEAMTGLRSQSGCWTRRCTSSCPIATSSLSRSPGAAA